MEQIKILGAGLSGLTTAINLALEGHNVKVFEKNNDCGKRFNGDFQGLENWTSQKDVLEDLKSMNIKIKFYHEPFYELNIYGPHLNKVKFSSKKPIFYLVRRGDTKNCLDIALKRQALKLGVNIEFNKSFLEKNVNVIATGPKRISGIVRGITFKTKMSKCAIGMLNDDIAPKGYAYLLIASGKGTIATFIRRNFQSAESYFNEAINAFSKTMNLDMKRIKHFSGYGNFSMPNSYEKNGNLIVGEAGGLQDFLFGFGMRYAITSGYLAARSIIEQKSYNKMLKKGLENQLKASLVNRFLFERLGNKGYEYFINKIKFNRPVDFLNKQYNYSLIKKIIYPFSRFMTRK